MEMALNDPLTSSYQQIQFTMTRGGVVDQMLTDSEMLRHSLNELKMQRYLQSQGIATRQ